jgi:hypothetical protein
MRLIALWMTLTLGILIMVSTGSCITSIRMEFRLWMVEPRRPSMKQTRLPLVQRVSLTEGCFRGHTKADEGVKNETLDSLIVFI